MQQEPRLTYALKNGIMVSINAVERGLACGCLCPKCKQPLEARKGKIRQKHFAHSGEKADNKTCHGYYMTALHILAEQIIEEKKQVMFPPYKELKERKICFEDVEREARCDRSDLQPDLVGTDAKGIRWMIEIRNTHEIDERKLAKIKEMGGNCLDIDVREQTLEGLEDFLLKTYENRYWINAPECENIIRVRKIRQMQRAANYLQEQQAIILPRHEGISGIEVTFQEVVIVNDIYLKARDRDGQNYLVFIAKKISDDKHDAVSFSQSTAVLLISVSEETDESSLDIEMTSIFWIHFPETGLLHDAYVKKEIDSLRKKYPGLKGKTDESCRRCPSQEGNKCKFFLKKITYQSKNYNLCLWDWQKAKDTEERQKQEEDERPLEKNIHKVESIALVCYAHKLRIRQPFPDNRDSIVKKCRWYNNHSGIVVQHSSGHFLEHNEKFYVSSITLVDGKLDIKTEEYPFGFQAEARYFEFPD